MFFSEQAKANAAATVSESAGPDVKGGGPAPAAVKDAKAIGAIPSPSVPKGKALAKAGSATPAAATAVVAVASTAAAAPATPTAASGSAAATRGSSSSGVGLPVAVSGPRSVLAKSELWELASAGGKITLTNTMKTNKRVPAKTVFIMFSSGAVDDLPGGMKFSFVFKKASDLVLRAATAGSGYDLVTLKDVIKDTNSAALYQHGTFTKAVAPPTFTCKKVMNYNPSTDEKAVCDILNAGLSTGELSEEVSLRWVVSAQGGKIMPVGVALVCAKQISLAAQEVKVF